MIIHYTHTFVPNSGELKRMKNIDADVVSLLGEKSVEVEFYPWRKYKFVKSEGRYTLSDNVVKKYYVPLMRFFYKYVQTFTFIFLMLKYRPSYVIGEMTLFPKYLWIFRKFGKNCKVIFDIHGAAAEEYEYQRAPQSLIEHHRKMEKESVLGVDYVICQSDEMRNYMQIKYGLDPKKACVYRCGVDMNRFNINNNARSEIRKKLGFKDNEIIFVYSGGLHLWQRVDESIDLFEKYHSINPKSKLLVLTGSLEQLSKIIEEKGIDNSDNHIISTCLSFAEVPDYLNACDVAFLLRHNHPMNAVASPTKLSEYMACGLPVITSEVAKKWVNGEGLNYCILEEDIKDPNVITDIVKKIDRKEISKFALETLSLDVDRKNIAEFFKRDC